MSAAESIPLASALNPRTAGGGTDAPPRPVPYGIVGHGWRADFYLRLARQVPDRFQCVGAVTRRAEVGAELRRRWDIPTYRTVQSLIAAQRPEVVVTCVPRDVNPDVLNSLVELDTAVLSETPPAADMDALRMLWKSIGDADLVQVAEQHPYLPHICALRELVHRGLLGEVTSTQISWTHDYHATALLRCLLGLGAEPTRVTAVEKAAPLLAGPDRSGWPALPQVEELMHTLALLSTADRTGVYDFTDGQWFNPLRRRHVIVRASRGEVVDDQVTWSGPDGRPLHSPIVRRQSGIDGNLEGWDLETLSWAGEVLYRNPYPGARMSDEEIAIATCLEGTARWRRGDGPPPYPLAHGCQDHALSLCIHAAAAQGSTLTTDIEPWAAAVAGARPLLDSV